MTAWELLTANSSQVSATAWEHLNSQINETIIIYGEETAEIDADIDSALSDVAIETVIESEIGSEIE